MLAHAAKVLTLSQVAFLVIWIMKTKLKKWGNSAAMRIHASIMAAAHIGLDQAVDVRVEQGRIVIEPLRRKVYKLKELLGDITGNNLHQRIATGAPIGKEIW